MRLGQFLAKKVKLGQFQDMTHDNILLVRYSYTIPFRYASSARPRRMAHHVTAYPADTARTSSLRTSATQQLSTLVHAGQTNHSAAAAESKVLVHAGRRNHSAAAAPSNISVALCVVGQLMRLELDSKLMQIVEPQLLAQRRVGLFFALAKGDASYVNRKVGSSRTYGEHLIDAPFGTKYLSKLALGHNSRDILDESVCNGFNVAGACAQRSSTGPCGCPHWQLAVDWALLDQPSSGYIPDVGWAAHLNKHAQGEDLTRELMRQQMHLRQWSHLRECMFLVDRAEVQANAKYDVVLKLREDTRVLLPWVVPPSFARGGITSLSCLKWDGVMDAAFGIARKWAWHIMDGMSADWYLARPHWTNRTVPKNPESWLRSLLTYRGVPSRTVYACELPMVSVRYLANYDDSGIGSTFMRVKPSHYTQLLNTYGIGSGCFGLGAGDRVCKTEFHRKLKSMGPCPPSQCRSR